jgi:uncharacterized membrane protein
MVDEALTSRSSPVPAVLAGGVVALQIAYPLVHGDVRNHLIVVIVLALAAAGVTHAAMTRGRRTAVAMLLVTAVPGFAVEVVGVHTGVPFGHYRYADSLGPTLFGTPLLIGLAWTMLTWPAAVVARRLVHGRTARILAGAWALASADLFLDPQLVAAGAWTWRSPDPHLPGVPDVPLTNFAGWLAVAFVLSIAVQAVMGDGDGDGDGADTVPIALYVWLYVGWIVALGVFLDRPAAAGWGAVGMGAVAVPLAIRCRR